MFSFPRASVLHNRRNTIRSVLYVLTRSARQVRSALCPLHCYAMTQQRQEKPYTICPTFTVCPTFTICHSLTSLPVALGIYFRDPF